MTTPLQQQRTVGITLGDPSGIGPEIIARTIAELSPRDRSSVRLFCDRAIVARAFEAIASDVPADLSIIDRGQLQPSDAPLGAPTEAGARAQVEYLESAAAAARAGEIAAVVTAPISKTQAHIAGFEFPGQTEFFAARLGAERFAMMFDSTAFRVVLATVHMPLSQVPTALTRVGIADVIELGASALSEHFGIERPRIGVLGLNPHAGEGGMFGREEIDIIAPAIAHAAERLGERATVDGPLVPDAAYRSGHDLYVAMYHDQALAPLKVIAFDEAVNVTIGLPVLRTSPDHGVAYDIAGDGTARHHSFARALSLVLPR